jgi:diaminopimelate decarboxylase
MHRFEHRDRELFCEGVPAAKLAADFGTPLYVYSAGTLRDHARRIAGAFREVAPLVCYSVKANSNLAVLDVLRREGTGFDVVSAGELLRVSRIGAAPDTVVWAGVGKTDAELREGLRLGIRFFNVESEGELRRLDAIAGEEGKTAPVALRLNPDVAADTHAYVTTGRMETKFGLDADLARAAARLAAKLPHVRLRGVHVHIGSQIRDVAPYEAALAKALDFAKELAAAGHAIDTLNLGGGFGITYADDKEALPADAFASKIVPAVRASGLRLILEPGRFVVGNAGILLARVLYLKSSGSKRYAVTDAGMNDLIRPSLYGAFHRIWPAEGPGPDRAAAKDLQDTDVVGPVCESGDFLGKGRLLPPLKPGALLAVFSAGAYGFSMASNYNSRPRPAEAMVDGSSARLVRARETAEDLMRGETV